MVLLGRIELPTSSLPMTRSTTELQQHTFKRAALCEARRDKSSGLHCYRTFGIAAVMKPPIKQDRDARLAEALRANLRRRKAGDTKAPQPADPAPESAD
jgi:hypothetical protein